MDIFSLPFEIQIFGNLCQISNRLETIGNDFLEELTTKQWFFLAILSNFIDNPPSINDMANITGSSHQNIKQIALKLEKKGFVKIIKDEKDKRLLRILSTKKTLEYGKTFDSKGKHFLSLLYKEFNEEEINNLAVYTTKLLDTLKNMQEFKSYKKEIHK